MRNRMHFLLLIFTMSVSCFAQDSISPLFRINQDSILKVKSKNDSILITETVYSMPNQFLLSNKEMVNDIQQLRKNEVRSIPYWLLLLPLLVITFSRIYYSKEFSEMWLYVFSKPNTYQAVRNSGLRISIFSVIMYFNFSLVMSMFSLLIFEKVREVFFINPMISIIKMIFLFTFFLGWKWVSVKLISWVAEFYQEGDDYINVFFSVIKVVGISMFPAVILFSIAKEFLVLPVFYISLAGLIIILFFFVSRGLSTSFKILYNGLYHFFIYVCLVEVMPLLLLIKLLTKTIQ